MTDDGNPVQDFVRDFADYLKNAAPRRFVAFTDDGGEIEVVPAADYDIARLRGEAAEAEVVALRARLAAQEWRPVTDDWPGMGRVVAVCLRDGRVRWGERSPDLWFLSTGRYDPDTVTHALPLPAPPQEAE